MTLVNNNPKQFKDFGPVRAILRLPASMLGQARFIERVGK